MKNLCLLERFSKLSLGLFFLLISIGFILSGITVLPIFGFIFAVPLLIVSIYFFRAHLNKDCQIEEVSEQYNCVHFLKCLIKDASMYESGLVIYLYGRILTVYFTFNYSALLSRTSFSIKKFYGKKSKILGHHIIPVFPLRVVSLLQWYHRFIFLKDGHNLMVNECL